MSTTTQLLNFTHDHYQVWLNYLAGATWVALFVQWLKKKFKLENRITFLKVEAKKFTTLLLGVVATLSALADVVINNSTNATFLQLLPQAASIWPWLVALAVFIHRFVVSGVWREISTFLAYKAANKPYQAIAPATTEPTQPQVTFEGQ